MLCKSWPLVTPRRRRTRGWKSCPIVSCLEVEKHRRPKIRKRSPIPQQQRCSSESDPLPGPSGITQRAVGSTRTKRKSTSEQEQSSPSKRTRRTPLDMTKRVNSGDSTDSEREREAYRQKVLEERASSAGSPNESSSTKQQRSDESQSSEEEELETGRSHSQDVANLRSKYSLKRLIARGGYGEVYNAIRKKDNFPVVIKRIPKCKVEWHIEMVNGTRRLVPLEVHLLIQVGAGPDSTGCSITPQLLDWYDLEKDLMLVLEKPEPCCDLWHYIQVDHHRGLDCAEAKVIFQQLVDAAIEIETRGVFHRDIKPTNILIETATDVPKARFIDFGCGIIFTPEEEFDEPLGTALHACPEWFREEKYSAGPTTVWQLGMVLYYMLFTKVPLVNEHTIGSMRSVPIPEAIPSACRDVIKNCLEKDPTKRPTLIELRAFPWFNS